MRRRPDSKLDQPGRQRGPGVEFPSVVRQSARQGQPAQPIRWGEPSCSIGREGTVNQRRSLRVTRNRDPGNAFQEQI